MIDLKRMSKKRRRRRRVIRNWICLLLSIAAIIILIVVIVKAINGGNKNTPEQNSTEINSTETYSTSGSETTGPATTENTTTETTTIQETTSEADTVSEDITAPVIQGQDVIHVAKGATIKYKSYIFYEDDTDPDPELEIDNSNVDLSREGTYDVIYTVTDASGNSASKTVQVVVKGEEEPNVDDATIYALADATLETIITDDMSDLDKVFAVFFYVRDSFTYVKDSNYWDYKQEAYHFMTTRQDNCYANVCLSKLLLERLGFQSYMVQGEMGYVDEYHYWNMVSIDGGKTWYQYDSAWWEWMNDEYPMCMMTDDFAMRISEAHGGIVDYAADAEPDTPTEMLWSPEERGYTSLYLD